MTLYRISELILQSNVPLPELPYANGKGPECAFRLLPARRPPPTPSGWFHHCSLPGGERWLSSAKRDGRYLLRFHDLADFVLSHNGERIACYPAPATPQETVRHLLLDQVIPRVLNLRGKEALHASAVATPDGACAFMGEAGWGKSTLAGSFLGSGWAPLSDDCLTLKEDEGRILGVPSYPGIRLWPDAAATLSGKTRFVPAAAHFTGKRRVGIDGREALAPLPLKGLYVLAPPQKQGEEAAIKIEPLPPGDGLTELVRYAFPLDISDRVMLARQFLFFGKVVSRIPVRRLTYPRDFSLLPAVQEAILRDMETAAPVREPLRPDAQTLVSLSEWSGR